MSVYGNGRWRRRAGRETDDLDIAEFVLIGRFDVYVFSDVRHVTPVVSAVLLVWGVRAVVDVAVYAGGVYGG